MSDKSEAAIDACTLIMSGSRVYFYSVHQGTAATTIAVFRVVYGGLQLKVLACGLGRPTGVKAGDFCFFPLATQNVSQTTKYSVGDW